MAAIVNDFPAPGTQAAVNDLSVGWGFRRQGLDYIINQLAGARIGCCMNPPFTAISLADPVGLETVEVLATPHLRPS